MVFDEAHLWSLKKKRADQDSRKMPYVSLPRFHWHHLSRGVRQRLEAQKTVARLGGGAAGMMAAMTAGWVAGEAILKCHGEKMLKARGVKVTCKPSNSPGPTIPEGILAVPQETRILRPFCKIVAIF